MKNSINKVNLFFIFILMLPLVLNAQSQNPPKHPKKLSAKQSVTNEFVDALNLLYAGAACTGIGVSSAIIGSLQPPTTKAYKPFLYGGLGLSLIGMVITIEGHSHIRNASSIMKLGVTANGFIIQFTI